MDCNKYFEQWIIFEGWVSLDELKDFEKVVKVEVVICWDKVWDVYSKLVKKMQ